MNNQTEILNELRDNILTQLDTEQQVTLIDSISEKNPIIQDRIKQQQDKSNNEVRMFLKNNIELSEEQIDSLFMIATGMFLDKETDDKIKALAEEIAKQFEPYNI